MNCGIVLCVRACCVLTAAAALVSASEARATTITMTFEGLANPLESYQGFRFERNGNPLILGSENSGNNADDPDGSTFIATNVSPSVPISIYPDAGSPFSTFDLISLNFAAANAFGMDFASFVDLRGFDADGNQVASFNFAGQSAVGQYVFFPNAFGPEWRGLSRISFTASQATPFLNIDDIVVVVPSPSAVAALGVAGLVGLRRRR